jgi:hypothetical protein
MTYMSVVSIHVFHLANHFNGLWFRLVFEVYTKSVWRTAFSSLAVQYKLYMIVISDAPDISKMAHLTKQWLLYVIGWLVGWLVNSCYSHLEHRASAVGLLGRVIRPSQSRCLTQRE